MNRKKSIHLLVLDAAFLSVISPLRAQSTPAPDALFKTIQSLDTQLVDAYSHCDLAKLSSLVAEDLELYHDKTGLARGRQAFVDAVKNNICGKVTRQLVPGSLEVYPLANYGALEIGIHRFHHPGHDDTEPAGEAKFILLWQNSKGAWALTRVLSFDQQSMPK